MCVGGGGGGGYVRKMYYYAAKRPIELVFHDWRIKASGMYYPVCEMVLTIGNRSHVVAAAGFFFR